MKTEPMQRVEREQSSLVYDDVERNGKRRASGRARSRISLSFAEAREMETGGDRRGNAEMPGLNQGTTLEISRAIFSPRLVNRVATDSGILSIHRHFAPFTRHFFKLDSLVRSER